tara:strand:- start:1773 stop:1964 length:192 start_codon:yes stop_codon:yes gene_type:complete
MKLLGIGNKCVECMRDTSFGSGLFVNRIPADRQEDINSDRIEGYLCGECVAYAEEQFESCQEM